MRANVLGLVMVLLVAQPARAQLTIEPKQPVQGNAFTVIADPAATRLESERFTKNDDLYAFLESVQEGVFQRWWIPLTWDGTRVVSLRKLHAAWRAVIERTLSRGGLPKGR